MNETAATSARPEVWIGTSSLLFVGHLPTLDWHVHPFACVLVSLDLPITIETHSGARAGQVVLATPATRHRLEFASSPTLSLYVAPHEPAFARLRHTSPGDALITSRSPEWDDALGRWRDLHDASSLREVALSTFAPDPAPPLDHRVTRLLRTLWRGEHLKSSPDTLASSLGLSASRLMHLLKAETGSTLSALQRGYRFWRAAHAMTQNITFTRAAHEADFADAAHFSRAFRSAYGLAPTRILGADASWTLEPSVG